MTRWTKLISIAIVAVLGLALIGATVAHAQDGSVNQQQQGRAKLLRAAVGALLDAAAVATNTDKAALVKEMTDGKSFAQVVQAHGGDLTAIENSAKGPIMTLIQQAVTDGTLTQKQADTLNKNYDKVLDRLVNSQVPSQAQRRITNLLRAAAISVLVRETAAETKLPQRDLLKELRTGSSLADIAKEHNGDPNAIVTAAVKTITDRINKMVSNKRLTQDQATKLTTNLPDNLTKLMNTANLLRARSNAAGGAGSTNSSPATPEAVPTEAGTPSL